MKENKEETRLPHGSKCIIQDESIPFIGEPQLRSAEEILTDHLGNLLDPIPSGTLYGIMNAMEEYAQQFKEEVRQKEAFTLEDMRAAFEAGEMCLSECRCGKCDYCIEVKEGDGAPDFDEWIKTRKK